MKLYYWKSDLPEAERAMVEIASLDELWEFVHKAESPALWPGATPVLELSAVEDHEIGRWFVLTWVTIED